MLPSPVTDLQPLPPPASRYHPQGIRRNFSWILAGDFINAVAGWLLLSLLNKRTGDATDAGIYLLGQAISAPVIMLTNLELVGALITDAQRRYPYGVYLSLRLVTSIVGVLLIVAIAAAGDYPLSTVLAIGLVGVSMAIAMFRDVLQAIMKHNECMGLVGG